MSKNRYTQVEHAALCYHCLQIMDKLKNRGNDMHCSKCGNIVKEGSRFCSTCGTPVANAADQADATPNPPVSDADVQAQDQAPAQTETQPQAEPQTQTEVQSQQITPAVTQQQAQPQAQVQAQDQPQAAYQQPQPQPQAQQTYQQTPGYQQPQTQAQQPYQQAQTAYQQPQPNATYIYNNTQTVYSAQTLYPRENSGGLLMAAFIFNLISTICLAFLIIPLAWGIPMTIYSYGIYKGKKPNTVAFGVCTLIFLSLIGGILMLVADKDE